jgi:uncharacterized protein YbaR (Trm112 family)
MKMMCCQCRESFENQLVCPECRGQLTYQRTRPDPSVLAAYAGSDAYPKLMAADPAPTENPRSWGPLFGQFVVGLAVFGAVAVEVWLWLRYTS